jgi:rubrerythrin
VSPALLTEAQARPSGWHDDCFLLRRKEAAVNLVAALARLAAFERFIGVLYDWFTHVLPDDEVAAAFGRLALQEQTHANLLEHMRRTALHKGGAPPLAGFDLAELEALTASGEALRRRERPPTVTEAVGVAMLIELSAAERIHGVMSGSPDPDLRALFTTLAQDDDRHLRQLMQLTERVEPRAA